MRIIAGEFRGRVIKSPQGQKTRPTSDRLRETLFNILNPFIDDKTGFLDLCAGTGAVGIEAISRGAQSCTFVDRSRRACGLIEENLDILKIPEEKTGVVCTSAEQFTSRNHDQPFDIIFFDPPYASDYKLTISLIADPASSVLSPDGILIVEHHFKNQLPKSPGRLSTFRQIEQGETRLTFYK
ncbi:MAG: 16S rRNA (guanine(966)-N(2))-methyltransferase RsmD [Pyrinomonadaceae bacterium]|nr:16S rRNA (guanine(966)-N(2))-methyltransferase RsmD [Pyrinomonadaceae bacterium]